MDRTENSARIPSVSTGTRAAAEAAAMWWANRLRDGAGVGDNGDPGFHSAVAMFMTQELRRQRTPTPAQCEEFERLLANAIEYGIADGKFCYRDVSGFDDGGKDLSLSVDYHPCGILYDSLIAAGVHESVASMSALPLKTNMRVSARRVMVAHGYGAQWKDIWGPIWGARRDEQTAADSYRYEQREVAMRWWDALSVEDKKQMPSFDVEWYGAVPLNSP